MRPFVLALALLICFSDSFAQDTIVVQTLTFDSVGRSGGFTFPDAAAGPFEKVIMQYTMRCKGGLVSTGADRNRGCGEWDYNCETYIIDSSRLDSVITDTGFNYWPQKFEIMSFVTPYGIGLDLGDSGKMWEFDVTDYLPILRGTKGLSVERGAWQEEMNIRFLFIKGTPPRNVIDIQQLWAVTEENYQTIQADRRFQPISVTPRADAVQYKLRSMITGHGQEGEFIPRAHILTVGVDEFVRDVWKKCADNPIYPQGGTWIYDRAGWCPGAATDLAEYDLAITPGVPVTFDYNVDDGSGDSRYVVSNQLVSYGPINFTRDAGIIEVRRPSERVEFARINPTCNEPIVVIRNNGAQALTSVTISYSSSGGGERIYQWTGNLEFLQTAEVTLPIGNLSFWGAVDTGSFTVSLSNPNGQQDEYAKNNTYTSRYILAPRYKNAVVLRFKSNNVPDQNYYEIRDIDGNLVHENSGFGENAIHYDSLALPVGCYTLKFFDDGENGINFWAMPDDGTGTLSLRQDNRSGKLLKQFNPDFGAFIQYDFAITETGVSGVDPLPVRSLSVYPNPANTVVNVDLTGYDGMSVSYRVLDITGRAMIAGELEGKQVDIATLARGSYLLELTTHEGSTHIPFVKE